MKIVKDVHLVYISTFNTSNKKYLYAIFTAQSIIPLQYHNFIPNKKDKKFFTGRKTGSSFESDVNSLRLIKRGLTGIGRRPVLRQLRRHFFSQSQAVLPTNPTWIRLVGFQFSYDFWAIRRHADSVTWLLPILEQIWWDLCHSQATLSKVGFLNTTKYFGKK